MNYKSIVSLLFFITTVLLTTACQKSSSNADVNEIVFGIHFGMEKDAFFKHCWDLNQEGKTGHGTLDNNVMYEDSIHFDPKAVINFYPEFVDNKIATMPISFYYKGWAPWNNKELSQERMIKQVVAWFEKKYETKLTEKKIDSLNTVYYAVIKPLTIRVYKDKIDLMIVRADIKHEGFQEK